MLDHIFLSGFDVVEALSTGGGGGGGGPAQRSVSRRKCAWTVLFPKFLLLGWSFHAWIASILEFAFGGGKWEQDQEKIQSKKLFQGYVFVLNMNENIDICWTESKFKGLSF